MHESKKNSKKYLIKHWELITLFLLAYDYLAVVLAHFAALWLRFDCRFASIDPHYLQACIETIFIHAAVSVLVFWFARLYKSIWRFASFSELLRVILATGITVALHVLCMTTFKTRMPISYYLFGMMIQFCLVLGIRFSYRFILLLRARRKEDEVRVMLIGAGSAGQMICRDILNARGLNERICCFIDDSPNSWGRYIDNVPVYGGRDHIMEAVARFDIGKIYVAIPSAAPQDKRDILRICNETPCKIMNLPGAIRTFTGDVTVNEMKPVQVEDLLGRDPIKPDMTEVFEYIEGKVVLITGVGSIGSELARQIASHRPKQMILFDIYENNAYDIQLELRTKYPSLKLETIIGSVRDSRKVFDLFAQYRPEIVYHAAAHKHVPLMEDSPCESIKNNAMGTYKTAYAAMVHGCKKFVLISTDKAVNPTNIMGASKRLCEMIIQTFAHKIKEGKADELPQLFTHEASDFVAPPEAAEALKTTQTEFVAVRFGNVLGSNGSVIPLFKKQIAAGGPVTVTHPDIIRYFMTIPEAVSLVLLAGTYARAGEIFVLDMGEPVKIDALARNLIRLSGYTPDVDIKVEYSGLRPGEKLYEEKLMAEEGLRKTKNELIHIGCPIAFDVEKFLVQLDELMTDAYKNRSDIRERVKKIVSTYHPID